MDQNIICPNCQTTIKLDEALIGPLKEKMTSDFRKGLREREKMIEDLHKKLESVEKETEGRLNEVLEKEREKIREDLEKRLVEESSMKMKEMEKKIMEKDEKIKQGVKKELELLSLKEKLEEKERDLELDIKKRLEEEREKLKGTMKEKVQKEFELERKDLEERLKEQESGLREAAERELELRKKQREIEAKEKELHLELERKLDQERKKIEESVLERSRNEHHLKELEKEKTIKDLKEQIEIMKIKAEQGSQQLQGEVLELELEDELSRNFPFDDVEEVKKGQRGADVLQKVRTNTGYHCGSILWETKRAKEWSQKWVQKLREDMMEAKADIGILCTTSLPKEIDKFSVQNDIVVTSTPYSIPVAALVREQVLKVSRERSVNEGMSGKKDLLYNYLTGSEFRQSMEGIVETFMEMKKDLDSEKRSYTKHWAYREKQMVRALSNLSSIYGSMQGLAGNTMPSIENLEIERITEKRSGNTLDEF